MYNYINEKQVYVWHDGALRQATIEKQTIYKDEEPSVKVFGRWFNSNEVYLSPADYQRNEPAGNLTIVCPAFRLGMGARGDEYFCWVCDGGRIKRIVLEDEIEATIGDNGNWVFSCPTIPEEHYKTEDAAKGMLHYKTINEDGSEREYKGAILRVMPNEAQRDLLEALKEAWQACIMAGLNIAYDEDGDGLYAYSDPTHKTTIEYGGDMEDNTDYEFADITNVKAFRLPISIGRMNEEYGLWIEREDAK